MQPQLKLDLRDRRILVELDLTARKSDAEIARNVGLSKESTAYRIRRMLSNGTIRYFHTIVDTTQLGLHSFRVFLRLQGITPVQERALRKYLVEDTDIFWFASTYGNWQYSIVVNVRSAKEFMRFWHRLYERYGMFFEAKQVSELTRMAHFRRDYLVPGRERMKPLEWGGFERTNVDDADMHIMRALAMDARLSLTELGAKVGMSYKTVGNRIDSLARKHVILGYRPTINRSKIGYKYYKVHLDLQHVRESSLAALSSFLSANPNVFTFIDGVGCHDFEFEMETTGDDSVLAAVDAAKTRFPNLIRNYEILRYFDEYKVDYLPRSFHA